VLPLIVELKKANYVDDVTFLVTDKKFSALLHDQPVFLSAFETFGLKLCAPSVNEKILGRAIRVLNMLTLIFFRSLLKKTYFVNFHNFPGFFSCFIELNRLFNGGKAIALELSPVDSKTQSFVSRFLETEYGRPAPIRTKIKADCVLSSHTKSLSFSNSNIIHCGYPRGFPTWGSFLLDHAKDLSLPEKFIFWPLTVLTRKEKNSSHQFSLETSIAQALNIIADVCPKIAIVFRYHPTTDVQKMHSILQASRNKNWKISDSHSIQLIKRCEFVFSTTGTSVFCDAVQMHKPIVQFSPDKSTFVRKVTSDVFEPLYMNIVDHFFVEPREFGQFLSTFLKNDLSREKSSQVAKSFKTQPIKNIISSLENL
jgi:hypothetical protein